MTSLSQPDPGSAPELAQVAPVAAPEPAVIGVDPGANGRCTYAVCSVRDGILVLHGFRQGRLGFGLGGGLS